MPKRNPRRDSEKAQIRATMKEHRLDHYYTPGDLFWDDDLNSDEVKLLTFIAYLDQGARGCWASNLYLSAFLNCSENTISTILAHYQARGFITIDPWDGFERHIRIAPAYRQMLKGEYGVPTTQKLGGHHPKVGGPPPKIWEDYKDESGEGIYKEKPDARIALSDPEGVRPLSYDQLAASTVEDAVKAIRARGVPLKRLDTRAARELIVTEARRLLGEREAAP